MRTSFPEEILSLYETTFQTFCSDHNRCNPDDQDKGSVRTSTEWDPIFLWFRPNFCCIHAIGHMVNSMNLRRISSVGCGSGLLEWILLILTGIEEVVGLEVNQEWWTSSYAPPRFIPHAYLENQKTVSVPSDHALMFCYFNDEPVFREYLLKYKGNLLILIGSEDGTRKTEPNPLALVDSDQWDIVGIHIQHNSDVIAFYTRRLPAVRS